MHCSTLPNEGLSAGAKLKAVLQPRVGFESLGTHHSHSEGKAPERQTLDPQHHFAPNADTAILHCLGSDPLCSQSAAIRARQD